MFLISAPSGTLPLPQPPPPETHRVNAFEVYHCARKTLGLTHWKRNRATSDLFCCKMLPITERRKPLELGSRVFCCFPCYRSRKYDILTVYNDTKPKHALHNRTQGPSFHNLHIKDAFHGNVRTAGTRVKQTLLMLLSMIFVFVLSECSFIVNETPPVHSTPTVNSLRLSQRWEDLYHEVLECV